MDSSCPRIQIWAAPIGGHMRIAQAVAQALVEQCPQVQIDLCDIYSPTFVAGSMSRAANSYDRLVSLSRPAWHVLFHLSNRPVAVQLVRSLGRRLTWLTAVNGYVTGHKPHVIVRVMADLGHQQGLAQRFAARALGPPPPIITVVSDLVSVHRCWVDPASECYLLPSREAAACLRHQGVPEERLVHVGYPIRAAQFCRSGEVVRTRQPGEPLRVLVMGGTSGSGRIRADVESLLSSGLPLDLTVVCGRNTGLEQRLRRWPRRNLRVLGYTDEVPALMRWADVLISKAGPSTLFEAVASHLPVIINGHLPGQEEGNTELFVRAGVACAANSPAETLAIVSGFVENRGRLAAMINPALAEETCGAVGRIAERVLARASQVSDF